MAVVRYINHGDVEKTLKDCDARLRTAVRGAVVEAAAIGAEIVARDAPVDTGRLKQSVVMRRRGKSGGPEVVAQAPYAGPVEVGSRPHWVPLTPLVRWVRRHWSSFNLPRRRPAGAMKNAPTTAQQVRTNTRRIARRAAYDANVVTIARKIQRTIAKNGTRPRWFMRSNLPRMEQVLKTVMRESKARALADIGGKP